MSIRRVLIQTLVTTFAAYSLHAGASDTEVIAPGLSDWIPWVVKDQPQYRCPRIAPEARQYQCQWPGELEIDIKPKSARFSQPWSMDGRGWITLPGDRNHWPREVSINDEPARVLERNGKPALLLEPGNYRIHGEIHWAKPPQSLPVAPATALIQLKRDGADIPVHVDSQGRLWLRERGRAENETRQNNTLKVEVFRLLSDDIPLRLDTELRLAVSGKPREIVLGQLLPDNAEVTSFHSPLPARLEADGRLRIQARAGQWQLRVGARFQNQADSFTMNKLDAHWPGQEIWSFRANPQLRGVTVSGAASVDPSQIDLPPQFGGLPTYLISPATTLQLEQQYRGDATPAANQLSLNRELWLDFDGSGATTKDRIEGQFTHRWRLNASPELKLGRVLANGQPQVLTRLPGEAGAGIEIRHPHVNIEAISRVEGLETISASGWQHDFDKVNLNLNLPPGWQLWHAGGPDYINTSWLSRWDLWDLFICLLVVGGLFRVLGWQWGLVGALTLALAYHERNFPLVGWVILVAALPALKVLPEGAFKKVINAIAHFTLAGVTVVVVAFAIDQVRKGIYPQLEQTRSIYAYSDIYSDSQSAAKTRRSPAMLEEAEVQMTDMAAPQPEAPRYRPGDNIQTGPGEPSWQWRQVRLGWSGPVQADMPLHLYLSPPWLTRILSFLKTALAGLLLYGLGAALVKNHWWFGSLSADRQHTRPAGLLSLLALGLPALLALTLAGAPDRAHATDFPPQKLLNELRESLLKAPACAPHCAAVQASHVRVSGQRLFIRQRVNADSEVAFPLPADPSWRAANLSLNGASTTLARADNKHWVRLAPGSHDLSLIARFDGDNLNIPFPLPSPNITVEAPDWQIFGLQERSLTGNTLQLEKKVKQQVEESLLPAPIKPFVRVQRQLNADIDWELVTTVIRSAPPTGAINLRIPLLPGESVVSQNVLIEDRHAVIALDARQQQVSWRSVVEPDNLDKLSASTSDAWTEHWRIQTSPRWHFKTTGLAPIKTSPGMGPVVQMWQPWPGESLDIEAIRPEPVPGPTTTVENLQIDHRPGARNAALKLSMGIRSSLGGEYRLPQPPGAQLQNMIINGVEQTTPRDDEQVVIPLAPGLQSIEINWTLDQGVARVTETPAFALPTPASNIDIRLHLPRDRWPILLHGPDIGPAMLYWGVLAVILVIAASLGQLVRRRQLSIPLHTWHWLLLALGMSTVNMAGSIPVVLWFFAMEARRRRPLDNASPLFNITQVGLILLSVAALVSLFATIPQSLLSAPDMQVTGNGSHNYFYQWYQDHSAEVLPQGWVFSLPLGAFRIAMLLWSLWLVFALMGWIKWWWQSLSTGQLWNQQPGTRARARFAKKGKQPDTQPGNQENQPE